jgi:hypothetical protein
MADGQQDLSLTTYKIRIKGHVDRKWAEWFHDLILTHESDGTTTLCGPLPDQTALHSVLDRIRDMNLPLISVTLLQPDSKDDSPTDSSGGTCAD